MGIWKKRNCMIFKGLKREWFEVVDSIIGKIASWLMVFKEFKNTSINELLRD